LKHSRQRASRRFLNDGARSSLPQYRQSNFSPFDFAPNDRGGRGVAFRVFGGGAPFRFAAAVFFFAGADGSLTINSPSLSMLIAISPSLAGTLASLAVVSRHCSDAATGEVDSAFFVVKMA
jgi:hypothetical protein